jgi:hypothetical protein
MPAFDVVPPAAGLGHDAELTSHSVHASSVASTRFFSHPDFHVSPQIIHLDPQRIGQPKESACSWLTLAGFV